MKEKEERKKQKETVIRVEHVYLGGQSIENAFEKINEKNVMKNIKKKLEKIS